jgi:hypothetical protein
MSTLPGPPIRDSIVELDENNALRRDPYYLAKAWLNWVQQGVIEILQQAPLVKAVVALTNQHASIGATPLALGTKLAAGLYRVAYVARVTTVDGVSSSLTVTLGWTSGGQALTLVGAAMTGDALTTVQTGSATVEVDANSSITYATTYASNTPDKMRYSLTVAAELLQ